MEFPFILILTRLVPFVFDLSGAPIPTHIATTLPTHLDCITMLRAPVRVIPSTTFSSLAFDGPCAESGDAYVLAKIVRKSGR